MTMEREVDDIVDEAQGHQVDEECDNSIALAALEVSNLLSATGDRSEPFVRKLNLLYHERLVGRHSDVLTASYEFFC